MTNKAQSRNKEFVDLITTLRGLREVFADSVTKIEREYKQEVKRIKTNYRAGVPAEKTALAEAENKRLQEREKLNDEVQKVIEENITQIRAKINAEIRVLPHDSEKLFALLNSGVNLSRYEFLQICESFGGGFWADKILCQVAKKNDISGDLPLISSADERISILDQLESLFNEYTNNYGGADDGSISDLARVSDNVLFRFEKEYTNGSALPLTSQQNADRICAAVLACPNTLESGLKLAEMLPKTDVDTQNRVLAKISDCSLGEKILTHAGGGHLMQIGKGEKALMNEAEKVVDKVLAAGDLSIRGKSGYMQYILENSSNPYIRDVIENKRNTNSEVSAIHDIMLEAEIADKRGGSTKNTDELIDFYTSEKDSQTS